VPARRNLWAARRDLVSNGFSVHQHATHRGTYHIGTLNALLAALLALISRLSDDLRDFLNLSTVNASPI